MYQRVMVPLDGSELALTALFEALRFCQQLGATLVLVHVYDQRSGSAEAGRRYLEFVREEHIDQHLPVEIVVRKSPVVDAILHVAEQQIDLIVMATHGRSGMQRVVYGSVAEQLLRSSTIPILLVRVPGTAVEEPTESSARTRTRRLNQSGV